jgi:hypothetical protein
MGLEVAVRDGRWVLTHVPAGPRPAPPPAQRQIILKTDQRTIFLEMGLGGKFQAKLSGCDEKRTFSKAMFLKLQYAMAAGC